VKIIQEIVMLESRGSPRGTWVSFKACMDGTWECSARNVLRSGATPEEAAAAVAAELRRAVSAEHLTAQNKADVLRRVIEWAP